MWLYEQYTGKLYDPAASLFATGYAGGDCGLHPEARNNPEFQDTHDWGPLPQGLYTIEPPEDHPKLGPFALRLIPDPANEMFGRDGFFIHGDSIVSPGSASDGCIIMMRPVREKVWNSGDRQLKVVGGG